MKENKYDDERFFRQYSEMSRSREGLRGAGEWYVLKTMFPDFRGKRVLDLGCGFGWHCGYAVENGAKACTGVDVSEKMLEEARKRNTFPQIKYCCVAIENFDFIPESYDVVISSLAFHYLESFEDLCEKVYTSLTVGGTFVFSVEHPIFTAFGNQDWFYDETGARLHWPLDRYFSEGRREAIFLGEKIVKYHKTLTTYLNGLLRVGFEIKAIIEPQPDPALFSKMPEMEDELRRPMMLLVSAIKK